MTVASQCQALKAVPPPAKLLSKGNSPPSLPACSGPSAPCPALARAAPLAHTVPCLALGSHPLDGGGGEVSGPGAFSLAPHCLAEC